MKEQVHKTRQDFGDVIDTLINVIGTAVSLIRVMGLGSSSKMTTSDTAYYRARAADARKRAAAAMDHASMEAHAGMAERYDQWASGCDHRTRSAE